MIIEEHELHYSSEAPLRAWRLFRVRPWDDRYAFVLSAAMYRDPDHPPWPDVVSVASCYEDHAAPAPGCRCGIYAAVPGSLDSLPGYLLDTSHDPDPWAYAEVACTGRMFVDMRGIRAERAEILRLALDESSWPDMATLDAARRLLRARYRVPVGGLEDVPDWVVGNVRDGGPPPKEVNLDLDLRRLGLATG
jgi:hypothetical protein